MSILDDAIREHLELKRQHGADEAELKRLEDEAFGPAARPDEPDPFAEAPTEFMAAPEASEAAMPEVEETGRRRIDIADLQEPPEPRHEEPQVEAEADAGPEAEVGPEAEPEPVAEQDEAAPDDGADDRHAIAEQPTELFDVEAEMGTEDAPVVEAHRPEAVEETAEEEEYEDEDFWSEQRLSDELDQALEGPTLEGPALDELEVPESGEQDEQAEARGEDEEDDQEDDYEEEDEGEEYEPESRHEDVLEDTPDFLEDAPEDDELWFEQRPPKDFDFDD